ncbi:MAG: acetyl-CoA carboxylase biotin carboxylase subunit [Deltaproteobacteria bacterium]|nr:acetyl-CoA carboxylase biotin carboxylase subunit [Deltaproteobacteria bacterium]
MFRKILIANRGEVALRVMRACRELGVDTVAVCSTADRDALHARLADERVCVGPERFEDSYLNVPAILSAALSRGADAVHPGYGLLAGSGDFAEACERSGLVFIGPRVRHLRLMGDKPRARRIVEKAGVRVLPGSSEPLADLADARAVADAIGYPLLVKTAAGGGRGLGVARGPEALAPAFAVARGEGERAFGNNLVYVERYLEHARHVEMQLVADRDRRVVLLGERDCSVQRERRKLVAEGPAIDLPRGLRGKLAEAAIAAATAVGYTNVGSVAFLVEGDGTFHFIEMNTRLQVEHAVPEVLTGVDLVREGIRIAAGEPLSVGAKDVTVRGHAIECRVHAEWPEGAAAVRHTVRAFHAPGGLGIRVESALEVGDVVAADDVLAKVLAHGATRAEALERLRAALPELVIDGVPTDLDLHRGILADPAFARGPVHTTWLDAR